MDESEVTKFSLNVKKDEKDGSPRGLNPAISKFFVQLPNKLQNILQVNHRSCRLNFIRNLEWHLTYYFLATVTAK